MLPCSNQSKYDKILVIFIERYPKADNEGNVNESFDHVCKCCYDRKENFHWCVSRRLLYFSFGAERSVSDSSVRSHEHKSNPIRFHTTFKAEWNCSPKRYTTYRIAPESCEQNAYLVWKVIRYKVNPVSCEPGLKIANDLPIFARAAIGYTRKISLFSERRAHIRSEQRSQICILDRMKHSW